MPNELQGLLGGMQASPRNKLMGLLADGLKAADRYANKLDPTMPGGKANQPLSLLSDFASIKSLAEVANNVSYGYPLTNRGVANVPFLKPETGDALMMAPISPRNALAAAAIAGGGDTATLKAMMLYHGSNLPGPITIRKGGNGNIFDGLFASDTKAVARSHGDYIHAMDVPDNLIMGMGAPAAPDKVINAHLTELVGSRYNKKTKATIWDAVANDSDHTKYADDLASALGANDLSQASWEAQRLRGALAEKLGFKASAMSDEHGTSYLVRPGTEAKLIESPLVRAPAQRQIEAPSNANTVMAAQLLQKHAGDYSSAIKELEAAGPMFRGYGYEESLAALRERLLYPQQSRRGLVYTLK